MIKRKGANVTPWRIPAIVENGWVSPSVVIMVKVLSVYMTLIAATISSGMPYSPRISNIFDLFTESKAFEKSTNTRARSNLLALDSSISLLRQRIWLNVDLPRLYVLVFAQYRLNKGDETVENELVVYLGCNGH